MAKILLVEDDVQLGTRLKEWFSEEGHLLEVALSGEDAMQLLGSFSYEVLLLDWTLPGMSGLDICKQYRKSGGLANIIFLTGRGDINDKEEALDYGADDYVTKPFDSRELSARVRSVLRRPYSMLPDELNIRDIVLDLKTRVVSKGSASEHLMPRESAILEFFMRHPNQVYSSQELVKALWESDKDITQETARSWMRNLRTKLENIQVNDLIRTIPKTGYVLDNDN